MAIGSTDVTLTDPTAIGGQGADGSPLPTITVSGAPATNTVPQMPIVDPTTLQNPVNLSDMQAPNFNIQQPWGQQVSDFLQSPTGQLLGAAVPVATGLYGAQQQARNIQGLTNQIRGQVAPQAQYGQNVLRQLQGGAPVAGPAGQFVGGQLQGAQALSQAAMPYATGQLTQGQQLALQQAAQGAAARTNLAYSMAGPGALNSADVQAQQAIGNQAIIAADQIRQQNIQFAQQALGAAQSTYNGLLNQSLASAELGLQGFGEAVRQQIAANQQIGTQMGQLFNQIAQGMTASNPQGPGGTSAGQQFGQAAGNWVKSILGQNQAGAVNAPTTSAVNAPTDASTTPIDPALSSVFSTGAITGDTAPLPDFSSLSGGNTFGSGAMGAGGSIT